METGAVVISHREYLRDISTGPIPTAGQPTLFDNSVFPINPGLAETFPWLSQIAQNFEQYRFTGLIFEYKTLSVDAINSTTINLGAVVLATDYNVLHAPFSTKSQMENYMFCSSGKPSLTITHPVECSPSQTPVDKLYVRGSSSSSFPSTGYDLRLYDLGNFQVATVGLPAVANNIGELWVSYEVEFYKPQLAPIGGSITTPLPGTAHLALGFQQGLSADSDWTDPSDGWFGNTQFSGGLGPGLNPLDLMYNGGTGTSWWNTCMAYNTIFTIPYWITHNAELSNDLLVPPGSFFFPAPASVGACNILGFRAGALPTAWMITYRFNTSHAGAAYTLPLFTFTDAGSSPNHWDLFPVGTTKPPFSTDGRFGAPENGVVCKNLSWTVIVECNAAVGNNDDYNYMSVGTFAGPSGDSGAGDLTISQIY